jgi:hypothetical protein
MKDPKATPDAENPWASGDPVFDRIFYDEAYGSHMGGLAGMNRREQEELVLISGTRKERKAIKALRKAREQAKKHGKLE